MEQIHTVILWHQKQEIQDFSFCVFVYFSCLVSSMIITESHMFSVRNAFFFFIFFYLVFKKLFKVVLLCTYRHSLFICYQTKKLKWDEIGTTRVQSLCVKINRTHFLFIRLVEEVKLNSSTEYRRARLNL